ncbi:MAG TPA: riboflavin synthase [Acidimicrobiales bacterium]|nr:riboflavin synthase [Acidimicrobiales bacterium]
MFTGIIEAIGTVVTAASGGLTIEAAGIMSGLVLGESVAVDGVDLTVSTVVADSFSANVMPETYRRSTLANLPPGRRVNLERSVLATTRLSGHIVRGVVEGTARVEHVAAEDDALVYRFSAGHDLVDHMVLKGPVAVDGASFTIVDLTRNSFSVSVVSYSQTHTTITDRTVGDLVNVETDILGRYVEAAVKRHFSPG